MSAQSSSWYAENIINLIYLYEKCPLLNQIQLKIISNYPIDNKPSSLVQIMIWRRLGGKPLSNTMIA